MNIKTIILLTAITTATTIAAIPQYNIIPLGKLTDNPDEITTVRSINDAGQIVGISQANEYDIGTPILYRPGEYDNAVDLMPNQINTGTIWPVNNNNGQIIGTRGFGFYNVVAIIFDESGQGNNTLIELTEFQESFILSTNESGQIPGSTQSGALINSMLPHTITEFDLPHGYNFASAFAVNNAGQAVGRVFSVSTPTQQAAFFEQGSTVCLGTSEGRNSNALAINNSGQIVGWVENEQGQHVATIFDSTGQGDNISLVLLNGYQTRAFSNNDNGNVVGHSALEDGYTYVAGFLFDGTEMLDLQELIPKDSGWNIDVAWDINNLNQIIGWGYLNGQQQAFLMSPIPEPATLTMLAIGALIIRRRKNIT